MEIMRPLVFSILQESEALNLAQERLFWPGILQDDRHQEGGLE